MGWSWLSYSNYCCHRCFPFGIECFIFDPTGAISTHTGRTPKQNPAACFEGVYIVLAIAVLIIGIMVRLFVETWETCKYCQVCTARSQWLASGSNPSRRCVFIALPTLFSTTLSESIEQNSHRDSRRTSAV